MEQTQSTDLTQNTENYVENTQVNDSSDWKQNLKKVAYVLLAITLLALLGYGAYVFSVYKEAEKYKKAFEVTQQQKIFCDSIRGTQQSQRVFNFCEEFESRFKNVEK